MKQAAYWDLVAEKKTFTLPFNSEQFSRWVAPDATILDIGCGYGRTLAELHEIGYQHCTGIDFSTAMIERGRRLFPDLKLLVSDGKKLPFADASLDAVILFAVITGNYTDKDQISIIDNVKRVLKPDGVLYLNDFLLNSDARNLDRYAQFAVKYGKYGVFELPDGGIVRHHTRAWIRELLQGFTQLFYEDTVFTTMNGNESRGFTYMGRNR